MDENCSDTDCYLLDYENKYSQLDSESKIAKVK